MTRGLPARKHGHCPLSCLKRLCHGAVEAGKRLPREKERIVAQMKGSLQNTDPCTNTSAMLTSSDLHSHPVWSPPCSGVS